MSRAVWVTISDIASLFKKNTYSLHFLWSALHVVGFKTVSVDSKDLSQGEKHNGGCSQDFFFFFLNVLACKFSLGIYYKVAYASTQPYSYIQSYFILANWYSRIGRCASMPNPSFILKAGTLVRTQLMTRLVIIAF